jgi:hypothetical protein
VRTRGCYVQQDPRGEDASQDPSSNYPLRADAQARLLRIAELCDRSPVSNSVLKIRNAQPKSKDGVK